MIIAIETATEFGGVALVEHDRVLAERAFGEGERHAASLILALEALEQETGRSADEAQCVALSIGPGSFTGLRIGLASALGLCFGRARQIVPVSTLAALAFDPPEPLLAVPMLDARKGQVYAGVYDPSGDVLLPDAVRTPEAWLERLPPGPLQLLGSAVEAYTDVWRAGLGERARIVDPARGRPSAGRVGRLGERLAAAGAARDPREVEPVYLRPADAIRSA